MERDYHELQRDHEMYKQRTGRAASEIENTNKKLNTQIHNDRKEIVRYKEVSNVYLHPLIHPSIHPYIHPSTHSFPIHSSIHPSNYPSNTCVSIINIHYTGIKT